MFLQVLLRAALASDIMQIRRAPCNTTKVNSTFASRRTERVHSFLPEPKLANFIVQVSALRSRGFK